MLSPAFSRSPCNNMTRSSGSWSNTFAALPLPRLSILIDRMPLDLRAWSTTTPVSRKSTKNSDKLTVKGIRPGTEHDALSLRFIFLKIQQMTDQHLNLCPITSEALHFVDGLEEIRVDVVVLNNSSGLRSLFVKSRISSGSGVGGTIFNVEFL